jgi:Fe2+ transport system protein FeoA
MHAASGSERIRPLSALRVGARGLVCRLGATDVRRIDRLHALGLTAGAPVTILQTFPGVVFLCDQTELAVERSVAEIIFVTIAEG